jgi:hypothetical protein
VKKIRNIGKKQPKIRDIGKKHPKIDPEEVRKALGAEKCCCECSCCDASCTCGCRFNCPIHI